ncbi:MAG: hypothetical protein WBN65_08110, partial [Gammaproteobacteria bacterium]
MSRPMLLIIVTLLAILPWPGYSQLELSGVRTAALIADETGERVVVTGAAAGIVPGIERLYTLEFVNVSVAPETGLSLDYPLPSGLRYVPGSATGPGTVVSLSVDDGVSFELESDLGDNAAEARHLRWTFDAILYPRTTGIVSFRARALPPPPPPPDLPPATADASADDQQGAGPGDGPGPAMPADTT